MPTAVALALLTVSALSPRVWIVDGAAPTAADTNPGTPEAPLRTIARAAAQAGPGDTVVVRAGIYRESVPLRRSGTPTAPITFLADPPGSVEIRGTDPLTGWTRLDGQAPIYKAAWNKVFAINTVNGRPIVHHPEDAPRWGRAEQVVVDGHQAVIALDLAELTKLWQQKPAKPEPPTNAPDVNRPAAWPGCFAVDIDKHELYLWLADGGDPNQHQIEAATRGQTFGVNPWESRQGVHDIVVKGFTFRYGASFPQRPVVWLHGHDNLMTDCTVAEMAGGGLGVGGTVRRCVVRDCGHCGGGANGDGFLNEDSRWEGNCWKPINRGWDAGGFKMAVTNGGVFRRCVFRHNGGPGLWFDIDVRNVLVTECIFDGNEGSGLFVEISRDIQVVRNLAVDNGVGVVQVFKDPGWATAGIQLGESERVLVTNNTCVGNKDGIAIREQGPRPLDTPDGNIPYHNTGSILEANLCVANRGYQFGLWYDNAYFGWHPAEKTKYKTLADFDAAMAAHPERLYDPRQAGLTIDRNVYALAPGSKLFLFGVPWRPRFKDYTELAAVTAATGFEARSVVAEPGFVDAAGRDYRLKPDSPARAAGAGWANPPASW
jgi:hypothetical protein